MDEEKGIVEVEVEDEDCYIERFHSRKVNLQNLSEHYSNGLSNFFDTLSCKPVESNITLSFEKVYEFMSKNLSYSEMFRKTRGCHCVSLCDTQDIIVICEDVARHNAVDKVIGESLMKNIFLKDKVIILSGRVSLEMILKAARMEIPVVVSKSAPTSLSVELAQKLNITLIGFARGRMMNVYSNSERIKFN